MSTYDLDADEAVILQTSGVFEGKAPVDLILTNRNLVQVNKIGLRGNMMPVKYPLSDLKLLNGKPNILIGKAPNGSKQLELYFTTCEVYYRFTAPFATSKWASAIEKAHKDRMAEIKRSQKGSKMSIIDTVKGKFDRSVSLSGNSCA